jgi:hypothetical protein
MEKWKFSITHLPALMLAGLSVVYLVEWRAARESSASLLTGIVSAMEGFKKGMEVQATRLTSHLDALRKAQGSLHTQAKPPAEAPAEPVSGKRPESEGAPPGLKEEAPNGEDLPTLPDGIRPVEFLKEWDLNTFLQDQRWNPGGRKLSRAEKKRALAEVTFANSMAEILESQLRAEIAEAMEKLGEAGNYVDYASGERPMPVPGVLTAGEDTAEKGMRIYYFYPEDFPGIYEKRKEKQKIAERTVRRLLLLVNQ